MANSWQPWHHLFSVSEFCLLIFAAILFHIFFYGFGAEKPAPFKGQYLKIHPADIRLISGEYLSGEYPGLIRLLFSTKRISRGYPADIHWMNLQIPAPSCCLCAPDWCAGARTLPDTTSPLPSPSPPPRGKTKRKFLQTFVWFTENCETYDIYEMKIGIRWPFLPNSSWKEAIQLSWIRLKSRHGCCLGVGKLENNLPIEVLHMFIFMIRYHWF